MKQTLKILIIEDNPADFLLVERYLRQQGMDAACFRVCSMEELERALDHGSWDLILSDFNIPGLSFYDSFARIQSCKPDLPVILVSGSLGEEQAFELLKLGVRDFVLKENLVRLVPAIEHSLRDAQERSARKCAEQAREATIELLHICNRAGSLMELMQDLMHYFQKITGCEAVGVRLRDGDDFPYYVTQGFSEEFVLAEKFLCSYDHEGEQIRDYVGHPALDCMCGNILCARFDPSKSFITSHGSFWSSSTTELLANTTDADRQAKTRNRCNSEGYESVALIPLRYRDETYGLFQFNDREKGRFSSENVTLYEELVDYVSITLSKLKSDEELRESNRRLQLATSSANMGIWDWDIASGLLLVDDNMLEIYGVTRDDFDGRMSAWENALHQADRDRAKAVLQEALLNKAYFETEFRIKRPDGKTRHVKSNAIIIRNKEGNAIRMIGMNQDVTDQKILEEQFTQSQKIEAVGQLAGGVAHDFNNILSAILGYSHLILERENVDDAVRNHVEEIVTASNRAADLTRSLLAFSRKQPVALAVIDLNELIRDNEKFLRRLIREDIELKINCTGEPLTVLADRGQIEQVIMNLVANARDAMPNGGTLLIETQPVTTLDRKYFETHGYYGNAGAYAVFSVSDSGEGMDKETQLHIFEPFFTTKEQGKGTGLGLSMVYGTVKKHNGCINVYSEPGEGTIFKIYLPCVQATSQVVEMVPEKQAPLRGGAETILVGEDDAALRRLSTRVLSHYGYRVIEAVDGQDAVDKFIEHGESIQLVILDAIMPKKNGRDACLEMRMVRPGLKVVFVSGYARDIYMDGNALDDNSIFIQKPISPNDLAAKVRALLDK